MNPAEFYEIDVIKKRGKGKNKDYLVHYRGWQSTYDEWKSSSEIKHMQIIKVFIFSINVYINKIAFLMDPYIKSVENIATTAMNIVRNKTS